MTQARLAPDMATVLTKAGAELAITIQPNGKGNFTINSGTRVLGDSADVQKVQSLGSFINDERKAIVKTSVSALAKKTIAAIVAVSRDPAFAEQVPRLITHIDKSFVDVFRTVNAQADMLNANLQLITQTVTVGDENERVRNHLLETGNRVRQALGSYLLYRAGIAEGDEPRKLNEFLHENRVMSWVFTRLCAQKLQLGGKDFEFRKVYFPKDPTKGLQITFRELKDADVRENQGGVLAGLSIYLGLLSAKTIRAVCGIPADWNLITLEGPAKVLANVPILVVPFHKAVNLEEYFSILAQNGDRGLPWSVGNTVNPQDVLKFLGTIPKRLAYGFIGRARFSAPWYENLFPGFVHDPTSSEGRSVFSQLLTQFRSGNLKTEYFGDVNGANSYAKSRVTVPPLIVAVMDTPPDSDLAKKVIQYVSDNMKLIPNGETQSVVDSWAAIVSRRDMTDEKCAELLTGVLSVNLDPRSKDARTGDIRMARSGISPQGASLIREFKRRGYAALSSRVDQWLRSFLSVELQGSVAEVIAARLEASLATPIQFGRGDSLVFLETAEFDEATEPAENNSDVDADEAENPDDRA